MNNHCRISKAAIKRGVLDTDLLRQILGPDWRLAAVLPDRTIWHRKRETPYVPRWRDGK